MSFELLDSETNQDVSSAPLLNHNHLLTGNLEFHAASLGERQVKAEITNSKTNRMGDVVVMKGVDVENFLRNPVIFYNHNLQVPVARAVSLDIGRQRITSVGEFPPAGKFSESDVIYDRIKAGLINATSIGFTIQKWEWILNEQGEPTGRKFTETELAEYSYVTLPQNADATIMAHQMQNVLRNRFREDEIVILNALQMISPDGHVIMPVKLNLHTLPMQLFGPPEPTKIHAVPAPAREWTASECQLVTVFDDEYGTTAKEVTEGHSLEQPDNPQSEAEDQGLKEGEGNEMEQGAQDGGAESAGDAADASPAPSNLNQDYYVRYLRARQSSGQSDSKD